MKQLLLVTLAGASLAACATNPGWQNNASFSAPVEMRNPAATDVTADYIQVGQTTKLENCGGRDGVASLVRENGSLYIKVANIECAYWATSKDGFKLNKLESDNSDARQHGAKIPVDESVTGYRTIIIGSKNYISQVQDGLSTGNMKGDIVKFYVAPQSVLMDLRWDRDGKMEKPAILTQCKGTVESKINKDRSLSVIIRNSNCTAFALRKNNGEPMGKTYALQDQKDGNGGSFTISKNDIEWGSNEIQMSVFKPYGVEEKMVLRVIGAP